MGRRGAALLGFRLLAVYISASALANLLTGATFLWWRLSFGDWTSIELRGFPTPRAVIVDYVVGPALLLTAGTLIWLLAFRLVDALAGRARPDRSLPASPREVATVGLFAVGLLSVLLCLPSAVWAVVALSVTGQSPGRVSTLLSALCGTGLGLLLIFAAHRISAFILRPTAPRAPAP